MNYEKDLFIDDQALDIEWLDQPMLFMKYARYAAEVQKTFDEIKQKLDIVKAELDNDIRKNPEKFGIEKVTESAIQSAIILNKDYQKANEAVLTAKYEVDMARSAVQSFNMRKEALEALVKLNGQSYFAGPSIPRDIHWEREQKQKKADGNIGKKLNRNR